MATRHVWEKWNTTQGIKLGDETTSYSGSAGGNGNISSSQKHMVAFYSTDVSIAADTSLNFSGTHYGVQASRDESVTIPSNVYLGFGEPVLYTLETISAIVTNVYIDRTGNYDIIYDYKYTGRMKYISYGIIKGSAFQGNASATNVDAYPTNDYSGEIWYVSLGSDTIDPSAVTYDASTVIAGDTVTVVISPSAGNIYGGTITYIIETNTDEAGWEPYMETTSTSFTFTIPEEAVSWRCRVKAKDNTGFTSDTYVYGNNAITTPTTVIYPSIFAVIPEDKSLGFVASPQILSYLVTTDEGVNYQITATVNGSIVKTATESPQARILELPEEVWEELSDTQVHELKLTVTQGDQQIIRTFQFRKFSYSYDTLYGLFTGIAQATRIKRGISRNLVGADFPKEILKITSLKDIAEPSYIDVVLPYVQGGTVVVSSSEGDIYESLLDESGTTRVTVYHTGIYSVQGYAGNSPSSSGSVTIAEDGDIETVTLQWIKLTVTVLAGAEVTATQSNRAVSGTAGENGTVDLILPGTGAWSLTASHEDYSFAATGVVAVSGYGNYTVTLDFVSTVFGENSWATIQRIVKAGKAASYWNVGDSKAVVLNGTVGE